MQSTLLDFVPSRGSPERIARAGFYQENPDGTFSTYTCHWRRVDPRCRTGRSLDGYLQSCFSDPGSLAPQFDSSKLRCSNLAYRVPTTPYIARRFARQAPIICHINRRTGKRIFTDMIDRELINSICQPRFSDNHTRMQLETFSFERFTVMEVPLHSSLLTGHLDCLICDDERDMLYALEVKSYPSDPTDLWAGTSRSTLFSNLVQCLAYCELLSKSTGTKRIAAGLLHRDGLIVMDARSWLERERKLLDGVLSYVSLNGMPE